MALFSREAAKLTEVRAKGGIEIGYVIPKGGAQMWFDNFAIPKDAKRKAEAAEFLWRQVPSVLVPGHVNVLPAPGSRRLRGKVEVVVRRY